MTHYYCISAAIKTQLYLSGIWNKQISLCGPGLLPPHIILQWRINSFSTESTKSNNENNCSEQLFLYKKVILALKETHSLKEQKTSLNSFKLSAQN